MSDKGKGTQIAVRSANELTLNFPVRDGLVDARHAERTRLAIREHGVFMPDGRTAVGLTALPAILATDQKGANRVYLGLSPRDKFSDGDRRYAMLPALQKVVSERIEEPRDAYQRERLRDSEACLQALRDAPELDKARSVDESKIRSALPALKRRKIEAEGITACQLTGMPLEKDAAAHHANRKADFPRQSLDLDHVVIVNKVPHEDIHRAGAESKEELSEFAKKRGLKDPFEPNK